MKCSLKSCQYYKMLTVGGKKDDEIGVDSTPDDKMNY